MGQVACSASSLLADVHTCYTWLQSLLAPLACAPSWQHMRHTAAAAPMPHVHMAAGWPSLGASHPAMAFMLMEGFLLPKASTICCRAWFVTSTGSKLVKPAGWQGQRVAVGRCRSWSHTRAGVYQPAAM